MCQSTHGYGKKIAQAPGEGSFSTCRGKRTGISHHVFQHTCLLDTNVTSSLTTPNNVTYQGAKCQPQMNPGQFSLVAFTPFTVNVLMSPLLVHCAKTSYKRKYKSLVKLQKRPFYIIMQLTQMTAMSQQQHQWQIARVMKKITVWAKWRRENIKTWLKSLTTSWLI